MTSLVLLQPPSSRAPAHSQAILAEAPKFLASQRNALKLPYPVNLLISNESQEKWAAYENILIASLQAGKYDQAKECIKELTDRFGKLNERVLIFQGMYDEATAQNDQQLGTVLRKYDDIITESPTMFGVRKRKVALLKSMGRTADAVAALVEILDCSPTDAECWAELSDLYLEQGAIDQAIFCLEEVLLVTANAWNMHAKLGEVLYLAASRQEGVEQLKLLLSSMRRFCRSAELSDDYLRGFYGLKLATTKILLTPSLLENSALEQPASLRTVQRLNELATARLAEIVRRGKAGETGWDGYDEAELLAAQALLAQDKQSIAH